MSHSLLQIPPHRCLQCKCQDPNSEQGKLIIHQITAQTRLMKMQHPLHSTAGIDNVLEQGLILQLSDSVLQVF